MKQVLTSIPKSNFILAAQASHNKYYGVLNISTKRRGFITRTVFDTGDHELRCIEQITNGNGWDVTASELSDLIKLAIEEGWNVFEFETPEELMKWVIAAEAKE